MSIKVQLVLDNKNSKVNSGFNQSNYRALSLLNQLFQTLFLSFPSITFTDLLNRTSTSYQQGLEYAACIPFKRVRLPTHQKKK